MDKMNTKETWVNQKTKEKLTIEKGVIDVFKNFETEEQLLEWLSNWDLKLPFAKILRLKSKKELIEWLKGFGVSFSETSDKTENTGISGILTGGGRPQKLTAEQKIEIADLYTHWNVSKAELGRQYHCDPKVIGKALKSMANIR